MNDDLKDGRYAVQITFGLDSDKHYSPYRNGIQAFILPDICFPVTTSDYKEIKKYISNRLGHEEFCIISIFPIKLTGDETADGLCL